MFALDLWTLWSLDVQCWCPIHALEIAIWSVWMVAKLCHFGSNKRGLLTQLIWQLPFRTSENGRFDTRCDCLLLILLNPMWSMSNGMFGSTVLFPEAQPHLVAYMYAIMVWVKNGKRNFLCCSHLTNSQIKLFKWRVKPTVLSLFERLSHITLLNLELVEIFIHDLLKCFINSFTWSTPRYSSIHHSDCHIKLNKCLTRPLV